MKRITLSIILLFAAVAVFAQDGQSTQPQQMKTLFGNSGIRSNGGYGGISTGYICGVLQPDYWCCTIILGTWIFIIRCGLRANFIKTAY